MHEQGEREKLKVKNALIHPQEFQSSPTLELPKPFLSDKWLSYKSNFE